MPTLRNLTTRKRSIAAIALATLFALGCSEDSSGGGGQSDAGATGGSSGASGSGGSGNTSGSAGSGSAGGSSGSGGNAGSSGGYPFQGYTDTRGGFESIMAESEDPRILIVDRVTGGSSDGDEASGRGSLPWALTRSFPRVVLFEISGVIDVGGTIVVSSPYVSVHGQTAPSPGITLYDVELLVATHDVIFQHLRVRMGDTEHGGGDPLSICGAAGDTVHDIIIDHCSAGLGHDEQLSISSCGEGAVRRVTLSNNIISFGLNYAGHAFGTLIDSGGSNEFDVDEILVEGNLYSNVSFRTPMVNEAARHVTVTDNVTYNAEWSGFHVASAQYPEGQFVDVMNNLYWRGPETENAGSWPTDEDSTWPAQPELWPWAENRRPVSDYAGPSGENTHVYYADNFQYVNNEDYGLGNHEGRPVELANERFYPGGISAADVSESSRQTTVAVSLMNPAELEAHVQSSVGCLPSDRDPVDTLAVSDAFGRTGGYIGTTSDLGVAPTTTGSTSRTLTSIAGYPAGSELADSDGDGLTDLEEWIYGL